MKKQSRGITLIALIITIIILLILVGVTISIITGEGLFSKAKIAEEETYHGTVKEQIILGLNEYQVAKNVDKYEGNSINYLSNENYIGVVDNTEYYRVKVEEIAKNVKTGKGNTKEVGDIYVIEQDTSTTASITKIASTSTTDVETKVAATTTGTSTQYVLKYYKTSDNFRILLYFSTDGTIVDPDDENTEADVQIPDYELAKKINYIEDLIDVAMDVNQKGKDYANEKIILTKDLDFANPEDYRDQNNYYDYNFYKRNEDGYSAEYYSLDSLTENDSYPTSSSIYQELQSLDGDKPGFYQIANSETTPFKGVFDGQGYTISNMYISSYQSYSNGTTINRNVVGMFGYNDGYICNLKINSMNVSAKIPTLKIGLIVGTNNGTILNCEIGGTYNLDAIYFGGIVANNNGTVQKCISRGNSTVSYNTLGMISGIVLTNETNGKVNNCENYMELSGWQNYIGRDSSRKPRRSFKM